MGVRAEPCGAGWAVQAAELWGSGKVILLSLQQILHKKSEILDEACKNSASSWSARDALKVGLHQACFACEICFPNCQVPLVVILGSPADWLCPSLQPILESHGGFCHSLHPCSQSSDASDVCQGDVSHYGRQGLNQCVCTDH